MRSCTLPHYCRLWQKASTCVVLGKVDVTCSWQKFVCAVPILTVSVTIANMLRENALFRGLTNSSGNLQTLTSASNTSNDTVSFKRQSQTLMRHLCTCRQLVGNCRALRIVVYNRACGLAFVSFSYVVASQQVENIELN